MKARGCLLTLAALAAAYGVAGAEVCEAPTEVSLPQNVEDVSREDLGGLFRQMKSYQAQVGNYRDCLDENKNAIGRSRSTDLFNASVDEEEDLVRRFNRLYSEFKSRDAR